LFINNNLINNKLSLFLRNEMISFVLSSLWKQVAMKFLQVLLIVFCLKAAASEDVCSDKDRVVKYLEARNEIKRDYVVYNKKCDNFEDSVEAMKSKFIEKLKSKITASNSTCVDQFIETYMISDLYLKGFAVSNLQLPNIDDFEGEASNSTKETAKTINLVCGNRNLSYSEFYQSIIMMLSGTDLKMFDYEDSEDKCVMKLLFENGIFNLKGFNISNSEVNATECQNVVGDFSSTVEETVAKWTSNSPLVFGISSERFRKCWGPTLIEQNFFPKVAGYFLSTSLGLNETQKGEIIADFEQTVKVFNFFYYNCAKRILKSE
jgi:hypothetical protein